MKEVHLPDLRGSGSVQRDNCGWARIAFFDGYLLTSPPAESSGADAA